MILFPGSHFGPEKSFNDKQEMDLKLISFQFLIFYYHCYYYH